MAVDTLVVPALIYLKIFREDEKRKKMMEEKSALEMKHGHRYSSKLGRNQCEAVAYKIWFTS